MLKTNFNDTELHIGDTVKVKSNIVEGNKTRVQSYEGIIIAMRGRGDNRTITVRHIGPGGIGVERIWPVNSPALVSIDITRQPKKVRRSKLYYMRELTGRSATRV